MPTTINTDPFVAIDENGDLEIDLRNSERDPFGPVGPTNKGTDLLPPRRWFDVVWPVFHIRTALLAVVGIASLITLLALADGLTRAPTCLDCDGASRVGVGESLATGAYAVRFEPCENETISRVAIQSADLGTVYWEAVASPPIANDTVVIGQVTSNMTETVSLTGPLPKDDLVAVVTADRVHSLSFRTANLRPNKVYWDGLLWSPTGYQDAVRSAGGCADWIGPLGNSTGSTLQWAILVGALGIAGLAASRLGREDELGPL